MPTSPPSICRRLVNGCYCGKQTYGRFCTEHQAQYDAERNQLVDSRRGSAASRGYDHKWRLIRGSFLAKNPLCAVCLTEGRTEPATDVDHIVPLKAGGTHKHSNLQALCHRHHSQKTAREDGRWSCSTPPPGGIKS